MRGVKGSKITSIHRGAQSRTDALPAASGGSDEDKVRGQAIFKNLLDVLRHPLIMGIVVGGIEINPFILQNLKQLILQLGIHFPDFIDKENPPMSLCDQPQLWLGYTSFGQVAAGSLVNGVSVLILTVDW